VTRQMNPYLALWGDFLRSRLIVGLCISFLLIHALFVILHDYAPKALSVVTHEDGWFENASALMYLAASFLFGVALYKSREFGLRFWAVLFAIGFFVLAGEEVSWGHRFFGYHVEAIESINMQGEFNVHNLPLIHNSSWDAPRFLSVGSILFGFLLPLLITASGSAQRLLTTVLRFPVPHPVVGVCLMLSYAWYRAYHATSPTPVAVEESRETTIALAMFVYALLVWRSKWYESGVIMSQRDG